MHRDLAPGVANHPLILGGEPVVKGTRIPTAALRRLHEDGAGSFKILSEYPSLNAVDIDNALKFEASKLSDSGGGDE